MMLILFPIIFIYNDILVETYGYERSRQVVWTGFACQALAALAFWVGQLLPPAPFWPNQQAYELVLGFVPRVALSGLVAYFVGEITNAFVLSKMKYFAAGQRGWKQGWRFVASTLAGEAADSIVFMTLAFAGNIPLKALLTTMLTVYVVKCLYEILALPISTRFANWLKRVENCDHIDYPDQTDYNPLRLFARTSAATD
jgi:uncharacterized integral membrane protein (TIGR00697 family)